eukprot:CAMPEP_0119036188 /NCGR_PEP_ID=MMETSP1177-20130426/3713_1 /TAXON_ID=2985 /ORGANISM="Ochromonas sp, Strain CCMP1899" /LENGTH=190 /DNA_ID=CAMNT_0006995629 /DNA_START=202 /DNA_END=771 /DNA_ORIENTATION=+
MAMMGGAAQETEKLLETVTKDIMLALRDHSAYAIGRLHQTLLQLIDLNEGAGQSQGFSMKSMMNIPESFSRATETFLKAKMNSSPYLILYDHLEKLAQSVPGYLSGLPISADKERTKLNRFLDLMTVQRNEYIGSDGVEGTSSGERGSEGTSSGETGLGGTSAGETGLEGTSSGETGLGGDLQRSPFISW